jgi:hypothetical protein
MMVLGPPRLGTLEPTPMCAWRLNIRLSSKHVRKDRLEAIQKRALAEGLPYQTLIASLLHKDAAGRLKEI